MLKLPELTFYHRTWGVLRDVIFVFSDFERLIGPKLGSFVLLFPNIIIFNTYLIGDAFVKMHFPYAGMHFPKCMEKNPNKVSLCLPESNSL